MDQIKYRDFFHALASNHLAIQNDADNSRFREVVRSVNPYTGDWDEDFIGALRTGFKLENNLCGMVLEAIASEIQDPGEDNRKLVPMASFVILKKVTDRNPKTKAAELGQCLAETQAVAEQIMAYLEEHNKRAWHTGNMKNSFYMKLSGCRILPVPFIIDNIAGTRVEFEFMTPKNEVFLYEDQWWNVPL